MITPNRTEWEIRCAFNAFCKRVLKHSAIDIYNQRRLQQSKEMSFSDLTPYEEKQLHSLDDYTVTDAHGFQYANKRITSELLTEAMGTLSQEKRHLILLYYFLRLSDQEISQKLNVPRSTIQYRRSSALERLKYFLEEHADEWDK